MITGSLVAIISPMRDDGTLDFDAYRKLIDWHIAEGTDAIVAVGTTGESPTVDPAEHIELVRVAVEQSAGRVPVIAGTGGNATSEAIELTREAKRVGASASLQVVPYYNKPTQEGMYQHFRAVAQAVDLPVILYNVPGRTVADLANDTVLRLAQIPNIIGIKDATANIERGSWLVRDVPKDFAIYSGDDGTALALMMMGGHGVISVTANIAPRLMHEMCAAALAGEFGQAREINNRLLELHKSLFLEPNPVPAKWALNRMGMAPNGVRLPLVPMTQAPVAAVESALRVAGVIA